MPLYEYRCIANGHQFDITQPVGVPPPACPVCGGATRKVYSSVGLVFKGSGFHVTDYPRPGTATEAARPGGTDGTKKDGGKTDASAASESTGSSGATKEAAGGSKPAEAGKS